MCYIYNKIQFISCLPLLIFMSLTPCFIDFFFWFPDHRLQFDFYVRNHLNLKSRFCLRSIVINALVLYLITLIIFITAFDCTFIKYIVWELLLFTLFAVVFCQLGVNSISSGKKFYVFDWDVSLFKFYFPVFPSCSTYL